MDDCEHDLIPHYQMKSGIPDGDICVKCERYFPRDRSNVPPPPPEDWDNARTVKPTAFEQSQKKQTSSAGRWWGKSIVYGKEEEANTPYMTRYWIGRLRLHIFHRGDQDPDCHDHPWDFWTFPLTPYVEEVVDWSLASVARKNRSISTAIL